MQEVIYTMLIQYIIWPLNKNTKKKMFMLQS